MSLMNRLSQLAKSPQGKELLDKAKTIANDPKTREKIDGAREKLSGHVETAKQKMAEKKTSDAGQAGPPAYGEAGAPGASPKYGEEAPANGAGAGMPPTSSPDDTVDKPNPTYGEAEGAKPTYGEDGPKAA